ncbi:hypothetical protein SAMN05444266_103194 [Chitinophaga jiangningensis]|uniref:Contractile injection system tube protein N-terminal domain-containing protein n=1 Tax=Chitinophaga jiangningensis TaxID=1419482 RepID=A0A1M7AAE4_9BACT|nr:hypothetical protein [Chitinophaga jiangningensis]SHL39628.1 hypothetical protein SAMN05444266_103194 [Chitinophaga jiangningensis]
MLSTSAGHLEKMKLKAYKKPDVNSTAVSVKGSDTFTFKVNPESFKRSYGIAYKDETHIPQGITSQPKQFSHTKPEGFSVEILLDESGIFADPAQTGQTELDSLAPVKRPDVSEQVANLLAFCYEYQGDSHRPNYILLCWGSSAGFFFGVVKSVEIDYKLFLPDGRPIRAVVRLQLDSAESPAEMMRRMSPNSPDMTHEKSFKAGNSLSNMATAVYQDDSYYIDVAKANNLLGFRNVKPGTTLKFPPLK